MVLCSIMLLSCNFDYLLAKATELNIVISSEKVSNCSALSIFSILFVLILPEKHVLTDRQISFISFSIETVSQTLQVSCL